MSANRPRARRSRMCRSVSSYGSAGAAPTTSSPSSSPSLASSVHPASWEIVPPDEGDSDPRGRRPRGPPLRGRARSRARAGRGARPSARGLAEPSRLWIRKGLPSVPKPRILGADGAGVARRATRASAVVINPGLEHGERDHGRRRAHGRHARGADRRARDERLPAPGRALVRGGGRVPARLRDRLPDARHEGASCARASGCSSGGSAAASRPPALADREGARRPRDRHLVQRREARAGSRARRRRDRQPRDRRRRRGGEGGDRAAAAPTSSSSTSARRPGRRSLAVARAQAAGSSSAARRAARTRRPRSTGSGGSS